MLKKIFKQILNRPSKDAPQKNQRVLVTSALPYINGVKHLGNLIGSFLPADVYTRYLRQQNRNVIFICGTDEHGTPAELAAEKEGLPVEEYCKKLYENQKDIYSKFNISFDYFGRTSSEEHKKTTQEIFNELDKNGYISQKETVQWFDPIDGRFLPDRFIEGECPFCGAKNARGDQCDTCLSVINAEDLKNPQSKITGNKDLEKRKTTHLFLDLEKLQDNLSEWIETKNGIWAKNTLAIARKWIKEGLTSRGITRDLKWGVPVPMKGFEDKVFYVWFDAPLGYISITKQWAKSIGQDDEWKLFWREENDTKLVQFMGKDNVFFHAIMWPAMIIGSRLGLTLPTVIKSFEFLNYEDTKFSTSKKRGVFTDEAIKEFSADYWRYYLLSVVPEKSDSNFSWGGFRQSIDDLANSFGNFNNRVLKFIDKNYDGIVPDSSNETKDDIELWSQIEKHVKACSDHIDELNYKNWFHELLSLWNTCDKYLSKQEPWKKDKNSEEAKRAIGNSALLCKIISVLSYPAIPNASEEVFKQMGIKESVGKTKYKDAMTPFSKNHKISSNLVPIFIKIEKERMEELKQKYSGK